jgi:hypothetical protein
MAGYDRYLIRNRGEMESGFLGRRWSGSCRVREGRGRNREAADRDSAPILTVGRGAEQEHNYISRRQYKLRGLSTSIPTGDLRCSCELSSHSMCYHVVVRRMQDSLMIPGALSCSVFPHLHDLTIPRPLFGCPALAVAGAYMRTRDWFACYQDPHLPLALNQQCTAHVQSYTECKPRCAAQDRDQIIVSSFLMQ